MDADRRHADDLTDLEKRLSGWRPAAEGLNAAAMLFAAGRASAAGRRRLLWPAATVCVAMVALALGVGLARERSESRKLAAQLERREPAGGIVAPGFESGPSALFQDELPSDSYLRVRRLLERDADAWPAEVTSQPDKPTGPPAPPPRVPRLRDRDGLPDL
jgi:hypothetical protein